MKKTYMIPELRIQDIDSEDIMDASLPIFDANNPATNPEIVVEPGDEVLGNRSTVWDE